MDANSEAIKAARKAYTEAIEAAKRGYSEAGLALRDYEERDGHLVLGPFTKIDLNQPLEDIRRRARSIGWQLQNTMGT